MAIEHTLRGLGVKWLRTVRTYGVAEMAKTLKEAMHRRARPQGDHRRGRVPARAPAPRARRGRREAQARRARGAHALRRRRGHLHRRPFLHPAVGLPVADGQGQSRSAARRPGGDRDRELRRLRPVRRDRARRDAVPVVLSRRDRAQSELVGSHAASRAPHVIGWLQLARRVRSSLAREGAERCIAVRKPSRTPELSATPRSAE